MVPSPEFISGRAILGREVVHVRDMDMESGLHAAMRGLAHKSQISIPLLRDGVVIDSFRLLLTREAASSTVRSPCCKRSPSRR